MSPPYAADAAPLVVVGDVVLDVDLEGDVARLCPDEPAPVVESLMEHARPGGAGLAALIAAQRQPVVLVTALGTDPAGHRVRELLDGVTLVDLGTDRTVVKTRVRTRGRTLLRLDHESRSEPSKPAEDIDLEALFGSASAVLVSDYGLGVSGRAGVRWALQDQARIVWDPHPRGAVPVPGVTAVTPNAAEAAYFSDLAADHVAGAIRQGNELLRRWRAASVTITRGAEGAVLVNGDGNPLVAPAPTVAGGDTCGAGDAFAAGLATSLATGRDIAEAVCEAVAAAAGYLHSGGVAGLRDAAPGFEIADARRVVEQTRARGGRVVMAGGCFDLLHAGHVAYLEAARALGDCLVVALNSDESVRALKGNGRPMVTAEDRARVLNALACVDAVEVFDDATPERLLTTLRPDIFAKGGDYHSTTIPEAEAVRAYGGEVVVLPILAGRSSTRLMNAARAGAQPGTQEDECRTRPA